MYKESDKKEAQSSDFEDIMPSEEDMWEEAEDYMLSEDKMSSSLEDEVLSEESHSSDYEDEHEISCLEVRPPSAPFFHPESERIEFATFAPRSKIGVKSHFKRNRGHKRNRGQRNRGQVSF